MKKDPAAQALISDTEFANILREQTARDIKFVEEQQPKGMNPQLYIYSEPIDGKRKCAIVGFAEFPDNVDRFKAFMGIGAKFAEDVKDMKPIAVFMTSEAWARLNISKEQSEEFERSGKRISDYPDKQEHLVVSGITIDGRTNMAITKINRASDETIIFGETHYEDHDPKFEKDQQSQPRLLQAFYAGYAMAFGVEKGWHEDKKDTTN